MIIILTLIPQKTARLAAPKAAPGPANTLMYFYHPDHLGTSTFLTDINGAPYQFFLNLPFGETMAEQLPTSSYTSPYKFNGKELDAETGLYYYGARYYDPKSSIWLSVDPLAEKYKDVSPYVYCKQNPLNIIDPNGEYLFGLFGSSASERRMARAEKFAAKVDGTIMMRANGRPSVNYLSQNKDGEYTINNKRGFGDFSSWKNVGETLVGFDRALEGSGGNEYTGVQGMREFGEDLGKSSTYVKAGGVVIVAGGVVTAQPEIVAAGVGTYKLGDGMDKASNALLITADINQGKGGDAAIRGVSVIAGQVAGAKIDSQVANEAVKTAATSIIDQTIDTAKEQALKKE